MGCKKRRRVSLLPFCLFTLSFVQLRHITLGSFALCVFLPPSSRLVTNTNPLQEEEEEDWLAS
ncbi:hypothetical protein E2C01_015166 [Portunus trituberculatus]|uniref:Uncharacterized protein n=1 Tax=Portunus trituberculatus TaxID=210409 RepID=A0A5B7DM40_PORTR|nr:hypothetical protein [Portunus trituberculatus]